MVFGLIRGLGDVPVISRPLEASAKRDVSDSSTSRQRELQVLLKPPHKYISRTPTTDLTPGDVITQGNEHIGWDWVNAVNMTG